MNKIALTHTNKQTHTHSPHFSVDQAKYEQINKRWTEGREIPTTFIWIELRDEWREAESERDRVESSILLGVDKQNSRCVDLLRTRCENEIPMVCGKFNWILNFIADNFSFVLGMRPHKHTLTQYTKHNGLCAMRKIAYTQCQWFPTSVQSAGLLVFSAWKNYIDAIRLLLLLHHTAPHGWVSAKWLPHTKK